MNNPKDNKKLVKFKNMKMWILEKTIQLQKKYGTEMAKIIILSITFLLSTILSMIIFLVSGLIRYEQVLVPAFAFSNTFLTYQITKPYTKLFNKIM